MSDTTKLKAEIAELSSLLGRFLKAQDPPVHASDQPAIDEATKMIADLKASIPATDAKRPFDKKAEDKPDDTKTAGTTEQTKQPEASKPAFFPETKPAAPPVNPQPAI